MGQGASSTRCPAPGALQPQPSSASHDMAPSGVGDIEPSYSSAAASSTFPHSRRRSFSPDPDSVDSRRSSRIRRRISRFVSSSISIDHVSPRDSTPSPNTLNDDSPSENSTGPLPRVRLPRIRPGLLHRRRSINTNPAESTRRDRPFSMIGSRIGSVPFSPLRQTGSLDLSHSHSVRPQEALESDLDVVQEPPPNHRIPAANVDGLSPSEDRPSGRNMFDEMYDSRRNIVGARHLRPRRTNAETDDIEAMASENPPLSEPINSFHFPSSSHPRQNLHRSPRDSRGSSSSNSSRLGRSGEDQAAVLSRLLSVAAAATAASLVGSNSNAFSDARDVSGGDSMDGSFESFLRALQNGRLASALRNGGGSTDSSGTDTSDDIISTGSIGPLNFFRMFRFGPTSDTPTSPTTPTDQTTRMIPVIIVGIRSVNPREAITREGRPSPPFLDALSSPSFGDDIAPLHRRIGSQPRTTPSVENTSENDNLVAGLTAPSTTPSASHADTPEPLSRRDSRSLRQQELLNNPLFDLSTTASEGSEWTTNSASSGESQRSSPSQLSNHNSRSTSPDSSRHQSEGTRSWIIYVLGGSYPENHPILTTPSLFTDTPTYEDMMLLSSLIAPVKPPVASREDVESAGGLFAVRLEGTVIGHNGDSATVIQLNPGERCLVCLSDFENDEICRQLAKCHHVFHKDCIDEWLTTGRNSCPLCRSKGVEEGTNGPEVSGEESAASAA
ncbi:uncharacterized protein DFL_008211 [Arthrobotrys flagrans]|uniref:RING-type domain-containing protein n=1 Tax=Arthrobotrys flagrans TaxID=97331 RepID=A0A436ZN40_ARTFL|nr:hypothetical protein DFL_008211 [Arthrobotrys flagrans]